MGERISLVISGIDCDARGCKDRFELRETVSLFEGQEDIRKLAKPIGWSMWVNRSRFTYCPMHGPRSAKLRRIW